MQLVSLKQHLRKEVAYPCRYHHDRLLKTVSVQFLLIFIFLLLFRPFGVYEPEHKFNYLFICGLHALSPALIVYVYFAGLGHVRSRAVKSALWSSGQEYMHLAVIFLITGIMSFFLRSIIYNNADNWSWRYLWEEIRNCYLAGVLLYFLLLFAGSHFRSSRSIKANDTDIPAIIPLPSGTDTTTTRLHIKTQVQQDDFYMDPAQLLFARADGNYIELTMLSGEQVHTELKRISLKQFEAQLTPYPFLFRCHRAYLVNLHQIRKVSGNAQGYTVLLHMTAQSVPVSRTQLPLFNHQYEQLAGIALA
ncbi:MAG: hypothetical protein BGO48_14380 [Mucilaginibacter sp. 44-25]|uniref:LytTR family DNA-binding domain-containing protein n=1 Tax=Mucilaginibacter sp. MD40 TaxID=2029590 RepID=UPI000968B858|nr:LytTR family DNA-binding domain-containing protein [Mucilaginibacter sp. MD40]OJW15311.1 MAG: hypothetical protein BGO48_14380 [Mucilaginibacter sp. 44-25]PAW93217.1 hypothetical protein CKK33_06785 [Mucilaginibacter sp. MD40]